MLSETYNPCSTKNHNRGIILVCQSSQERQSLANSSRKGSIKRGNCLSVSFEDWMPHPLPLYWRHPIDFKEVFKIRGEIELG